MKTTQERLSEVYCVLKSDEEATAVFHVDCAYLMHYPETWGKGDKVMVTDGMLGVWYNSTRTEIPVSHFIDLLNDSIVPWRLEEDGFKSTPWIDANQYEIALPKSKSVTVFKGQVTAWDDIKNSEIDMDGITTYTDLLTLIRLIG